MSQIRNYKAGKFYKDEFRGQLSWNGNEHNVLLRSEGIAPDGTLKFADVAMAVGADDVKDARGMAVADFDNDGDLDIVVNTNPGDCGKPAVPPVLLRNDVGQRRNWLAVKLTGVESNRDALGAQVVAVLRDAQGRRTQLLRHVTAGGGYASQHSDRLYFGLGDHTHVERLTVRWPSGRVQQFESLPAKQLIELTEGGKVAARPLNPPAFLSAARAGQAAPHN